MFDLDHVGIAVRDLDAAAERYRRLGFMLTERSHHQARSGPDAAPQPVGTGNHCIMLERGYVELIGVTQPNYTGRLRDVLARREGLHILALGCSDGAEAVRHLRTRGVTAAPGRRIERPILERGVPAVAAFTIIDLPDALLPGTHVLAIEHHTRPVLWQPHLISHPNGALSLERLIIVDDAPEKLQRKLADALGTLDAGVIEVVDPASRRGTAPAPALPFLAELTLGIVDVDGAARLLARNGVPAQRDAAGDLLIGPDEACGVALTLRATARAGR